MTEKEEIVLLYHKIIFYKFSRDLPKLNNIIKSANCNVNKNINGQNISLIEIMNYDDINNKILKVLYFNLILLTLQNKIKITYFIFVSQIFLRL